MPRVGKNNHFPYTTQGLEDAKRFAAATGGEIVYDKHEKPEPEKADESTGPTLDEMSGAIDSLDELRQSAIQNALKEEK